MSNVTQIKRFAMYFEWGFSFSVCCLSLSDAIICLFTHFSILLLIFGSCMLSISLGVNPLSTPKVNWKSPYALTGMFNTWWVFVWQVPLTLCN